MANMFHDMKELTHTDIRQLEEKLKINSILGIFLPYMSKIMLNFALSNLKTRKEKNYDNTRI